MADQQTVRTMAMDDVPPMRRFCEHPEHEDFERAPVAAFIISRTSRNAALRGGLYVCEEHAAVNAKFVVKRVVADTPTQDDGTVEVPQCGACLAFDGGHEEWCDLRDATVPPSPAWSVSDATRARRGGAI